jgi:peptidoglycan/LPS O-acetylase OafA/YrhL
LIERYLISVNSNCLRHIRQILRLDVNKETTTVNYRADIDGLRAIAVIAVVGFHAFPGFLPGGYVGVDVFFVISGFLISRIIFTALEKDKFSYLDFYSRRIRRIFPALAIILAFSLVVGWFVFLPREYAMLGRHVAAGAAFIANLIFWSEAGYFDLASHTKPLLHLWSLGIEEQFYFLYPLILPIIWKVRGHRILLLSVLTACSFALSIYFVGTDKSAAFYSPITRFWELSIGGLVAMSQYNNQTRKSCLTLAVHNYVSIAGAGLIVTGLVLVTSRSTFPGWWALFPVIGTTLLLWSGSATYISRILSNRLLVGIGLISYPLYLWHWPLLTFAHSWLGEHPSRIVRAAIVGLSVLLAWLTYRLIEKPIRHEGRKKNLVLSLLLLMTMVGVLGLAVNYSNGIPSRMPSFIQTLSTIEFDHSIRTRVGTCFLLNGQTSRDFSNCRDDSVEGRKTALLVGDSHASHLYPGLSERFGKSVNVIQRTAGGCPPMLGPQTDSMSQVCKDVNDYIKRWVSENRPEIVVLAGNWIFYPPNELQFTVRWLKQAGVSSIYVVGPVPQWRESLIKQLYLHYRKTGQASAPNRMLTGLSQGLFEVDQELGAVAQKEGAEYVSPVAMLCDTHGCLTRYDSSLETVLTWDYGHLTNGASEFLVSKFPDITK